MPANENLAAGARRTTNSRYRPPRPSRGTRVGDGLLSNSLFNNVSKPGLRRLVEIGMFVLATVVTMAGGWLSREPALLGAGPGSSRIPIRRADAIAVLGGRLESQPDGGARMWRRGALDF